MCHLQVVDCDFSYAGCNEKLQRQDMEKHLEENTQKHLALMAAESIKMRQEFEKKLQEQRDEFQGYLEQKESDLFQQLQRKDTQIDKSLQEQQQREIGTEVQGEVGEKNQQIGALAGQIVQVQQDHVGRIKAVEQRRVEVKIRSLEVQSQQQVERIGKLEKQLKEKERKLEQLNMKLGIPPFYFTLSNFNQLKTKDTCWYGPPTYTHLYGYRFFTVVYSNGWGRGKGTHVTVYLYSMSGEFDATLQWPAKVIITLQLLNQYRDQDHITVTKQFQWTKPENDWVYAGDFHSRFVAHNVLEWNAQKRTQYLKDDCLYFRVAEIEVLE